MVDNTKVLDQNPVSSPIAGSSVQPQVGFLHKEQDPIGQNLSEFVRPSGPEVSPNLTHEVTESGVKVPTDKPFLTPAHIESGLAHSGPDVTVPADPTGLVQISEKQDITSSGTWLNTLMGRIKKVMKLMGV